MRLEGKALFLVEPKYFDMTKKMWADAAKERKRKAAEREVGNPHPAKCARTMKGSKLGFVTGIPRVGIFHTVPVPANTVPVFARCLTKPAVSYIPAVY